VELAQNARDIAEVVAGKFGEEARDGADARGLVIEERGSAGCRQDHVDLALVHPVDAAGNQGPLAGLESADDARHLRWQDAELALQVADDQRLALVE